MSLQERIVADLKTAMLAGNKDVVTTLRMLQSELKNAQIATGAALNDEAAFQVIRKEIKKRNDSISMYENGGRPEKAAAERAEAELLGTYLPAQADSQEIETFAEQVISAFPDKTPARKGEAIRAVMAKFGAQADGKTVSEIVSRLLS